MAGVFFLLMVLNSFLRSAVTRPRMTIHHSGLEQKQVNSTESLRLAKGCGDWSQTVDRRIDGGNSVGLFFRARQNSANSSFHF